MKVKVGLIQDYKLRGQLNLTDIPENALRVVDKLSFRFSDYKVIQTTDIGEPTTCLLGIRKRAF